MEEWRPLPCEPSYDVSSFGRVRSWRLRGGHSKGMRRKEPIILKPRKLRTGYLGAAIVTSEGVKHLTIHAIVARAFIGERPTGLVVNHKDLDKENNRPSNLEYITRTENEDHAYAAEHKQNSKETREHLSNTAYGRRLTRFDVIKIREMRRFGAGLLQISQQFGIAKSYARAICGNRKWRWLTEGV